MRPPTARSIQAPNALGLGRLGGHRKGLNMFNDSIILPEKLLSVEDLSQILGQGPKTLYQKLSKDPSLLPPRFYIPGSRLVRFHPVVVRIWMDSLAGLTSTPSNHSIESKTLKKENRAGPGRPPKAETVKAAKNVVR